MIVVTYLLRQSITLYKNLGGLEQNLGELEPLSPIASAATALNKENLAKINVYRYYAKRQTHTSQIVLFDYRYSYNLICY